MEEKETQAGIAMRYFRKQNTSVRKRIFYYNALMTLVTAAICILIGVFFVKIYWETEEKTLQQFFEREMTGSAVDDLVESLTVHNGIFNLMFGLFAVLCIVTLIVVSRLFTTLLSRRIMQPLELLEEGAERIRGNDYSVPVAYRGDMEFEKVCDAFNSMQKHLREEKEKNLRYEKARQEMVAGISHDLRSPLTAIRGAVKGVLDGVASGAEQERKFLQTAYRRSGEMDRLLSQLFYFSKMETGGISVQMCRMNLSGYLESFFSSRREQPDMAGTEFILDLPQEDIPPVQADPEALRRILDNIFVNSGKYASVSPLKIYASVRRLPGGWQEVVLQDNGIGVPADRIGRVFDEFYRVDESRGKKEGNGLGLYIVRHLCEAMGGRVYADTEEHYDGFRGLAVILELREAESENHGEEGQNTDY
jgi:signal transduction histidine kinase